VTVRETVDARKQSFGAGQLRALFRAGRRLFVCRGQHFVELDLRRAKPADLSAVLGPSGNLRAPAARVGQDWLVGFADEAWEQVLG
jgi:hypothetical protein